MELYPQIYLYRRVVQSKLFIDRHFAGEIDLHSISGEACFSRFHFIRLFKKIYHKTPHQYLTAVRLQQAAQLLATGMPVTGVCYSVGFTSVSSFTGLFSRHFGATPSAYRQQHQLRQADLRRQPLKYIPHCFAEQKGWTKTAILEK